MAKELFKPGTMKLNKTGKEAKTGVNRNGESTESQCSGVSDDTGEKMWWVKTDEKTGRVLMKNKDAFQFSETKQFQIDKTQGVSLEHVVKVRVESEQLSN